MQSTAETQRAASRGRHMEWGEKKGTPTQTARSAISTLTIIEVTDVTARLPSHPRLIYSYGYHGIQEKNTATTTTGKQTNKTHARVHTHTHTHTHTSFYGLLLS